MLIPPNPLYNPRMRDGAALLYFNVEDKPISLSIDKYVNEYRLRGRCGAFHIRDDIQEETLVRSIS